MQNVSHENDLIFMRMNEQVTYDNNGDDNNKAKSRFSQPMMAVNRLIPCAMNKQENECCSSSTKQLILSLKVDANIVFVASELKDESHKHAMCYG